MSKYPNHTYDLNDPELVSIVDDLPLWSAPFGMTLLDMVRYRPGMNVLDIGCGLGFPMIELAQRLGASSAVYGIDPSESFLERVKLKIKKLGLANVTVVKGKAEKLQFDDAFFDLIVSNNGLNNVDDIEAVLAECRRVCRNGSQMVVTMNLPDTMKEFYDIYQVVLEELGKTAEIGKIDEHIYSKRKPLRETEDQLTGAGFTISSIRKETRRFGKRFCTSCERGKCHRPVRRIPMTPRTIRWRTTSKGHSTPRQPQDPTQVDLRSIASAASSMQTPSAT
jgi:ubiquinone/menaquinone biosynthesis C-methylase UbiE